MSVPGGSVVAGRLEIEVHSDTDKFDDGLRAKLQALADKITAKVGIEAKDSLRAQADFRKSVKEFVSKAAAGVDAQIGVDVRDNPATRAELRKKIESHVRKAAAGVKAKITVDVDPRQVEERVRSATRVVSQKAIGVKVAAEDRVTRETTGMVDRAQAAVGRGINVPVHYDRTSKHGPPPWTPRANPYGPAGAAFRPTMMLGLISLIQPAIAVLMQSLGGLVAMVGNLGVSIYSLNTAIPVLSMLGAAIGAGIIAFTGWDAEGKNSVKSMRQVAAEVKSLTGEWNELTHAVRHSVWDGVAGQIRPLGEKLLPVLTFGLSRVGQEIGWLMRAMTRSMGTTRFKHDLEDILETSKGLTRSIGRGLGGLLTWFVNMSVTAGPLAERMGKAFQRFGEWAASLHDTAAERAAFRDWLDYSGEKATQLGRIIKNTWNALASGLEAARPSGERLLDTFEEMTERWAAWSASVEGQNTLREWYDTAEAGTRAVGTFLVEIGRALARLAQDDTIGGLVNQLTTELLPPLETFLRTLGTTLGPQVIDFIATVLEILAQLSSAGAPLAWMLSVVNDVTEVFRDLLVVVPGAADALGTLFGVMLVSRTVGFAMAGLSGALQGMIVKLGGLAGLAGVATVFITLTGSLERFGPAVEAAALALGGLLLVGPKIGAFGAAVTTALTNIRQRSRDLAALDAGMRNIQGSYAGMVTKIDESTGRLVVVGGEMRRTGDDADGAARKTGRLGDAQGRLYKAMGPLPGAMRGLSTAAGGLLAALGGPWGIAIGAAGAVLLTWYQRHQDAKAAVEAHTQAILDNGGAMSKANTEMVAAALQAEGAVEAAEKIGVSFETLLAASMGVPEAVNEVNDAIARARDPFAMATTEQERLNAAWGLAPEAAEGLASAASTVEGAVGGQNKVVGEATDKAKAAAEAADAAARATEEYGLSAEGATEDTHSLTFGTQELAEVYLVARDYLDQLVQKQKEQRELNMSAREAYRDMKDGLADLADETKRLKESTDDFNQAILDGGKGFDITTESGRRLEEMYYRRTDEIWRAIEAAERQGATDEELAAIWEEGATGLDKWAGKLGLKKGALEALRIETGMTRAEFELYLANLEKTPEEVNTDVKLSGTAQAAQDAADYGAHALGGIPTDKETKARLKAEEAKEEARVYKALLDANPKDVTTTASVYGTKKGEQLLAQLKAKVTSHPKTAATIASVPGFGLANFMLETITESAHKIPGRKSTTVAATTGSAWSALQGIINQLWKIQSKTVTVTTNRVDRFSQQFAANGGMFFADGGIRPPVAKFAGGGMPFWERKMQNRLRAGFDNIEQHFAQILPAGTWRVSAEPETGGEAYIPLASGKRRRSVQILEEVAQRFGMALMPIAAQFAGGGMAVPAVGGGGNSGGVGALGSILAAASRQGTQVVFEAGSIVVQNPVAEPTGKSVASIARGLTLDGLFEGDDD